MLDQLVESKNSSGENNTKNILLLGTFAIVSILLIVGVVTSLFAKDYGMGGGDLEFSALVAPVPVPEEEPPPPPEVKPEVKQQKVEPNVVLRKDLILDINSTAKEPDKTQATKSTEKTMPPGLKVQKSSVDFDPSNALKRDDTGEVYNDPRGAGSGNQGTPGGTGQPLPTPPPLVVKKPDPPKITKPVSGGVLNGKATSLPKPPYPPAARAVRASGAVSVQVLISESGSVISASAVSGHPLLRQAAEQAARGARFSPTTLTGQAVKVSGIITYNFVP